MALILRDSPSNDVVLSVEQSGTDIDLFAEANGEKVLIAFFNSSGSLVLTTNSTREVGLFKGSLKFTEDNILDVVR